MMLSFHGGSGTLEGEKPLQGLRFGNALLAVSAIVWLAAAIAPVDRAAWLLENIVLAAAVAWVIVTRRKWPLSRTSYLLLFIFFVLHVVGAHYTYSATPLGDWLRGVFHTKRNHYDRLVHFLFGLLTVYPIREQIGGALRISKKSAYVFAFMLIVVISTAYELLEWLAAEIVSTENTFAFVGSQGDMFDSQKDTALAVVGALLGIGVNALFTSRSSRHSLKIRE